MAVKETTLDTDQLKMAHLTNDQYKLTKQEIIRCKEGSKIPIYPYIILISIYIYVQIYLKKNYTGIDPR